MVMKVVDIASPTGSGFIRSWKIKGVTRQLLFEEYQAQGRTILPIFAVLRSLQQMAQASETLRA